MTAHLHLLYALVGALGLGLALVSRGVRRLPVSEPLAALALGVVVGPRALGLVETDPAAVEAVLREGARLLLAWSVMAAVLRFRLAALRDVGAAAVVLPVVEMPWPQRSPVPPPSSWGCPSRSRCWWGADCRPRTPSWRRPW